MRSVLNLSIWISLGSIAFFISAPEWDRLYLCRRGCVFSFGGLPLWPRTHWCVVPWWPESVLSPEIRHSCPLVFRQPTRLLSLISSLRASVIHSSSFHRFVGLSICHALSWALTVFHGVPEGRRLFLVWICAFWAVFILFLIIAPLRLVLRVARKY